MGLQKRYHAQEVERRLQDEWAQQGIYRYEGGAERPLFTIDTPPPTASGLLHLGHTYSYSQADFIARFQRMSGQDVFYPMGFDDNGLPTERLVERRLGIRAGEGARRPFIEQCLALSEEIEQGYRSLFQRLGLSVDWRFTYRTSDERSRQIAQRAFLDLLQRGLAYRQQAPAIWCPECRTAIAQAEVEERERESHLYTLAFSLAGDERLLIATTRPELLPACVAIFVHPQDERYRFLVGQEAQVPLFGQWVPILEDPAADPEKGSGAVMCCTFGDRTDVEWWQRHRLPLVQALDRAGRLTEVAGPFTSLSVPEARRQIVDALEKTGQLPGRVPVEQHVRVHERCERVIEYIVTQQWYIRLLPFRERLLEAGEQIEWYPPHMKARYRAWVENLGWDWSISRQRTFGIPFPLWYCNECGTLKLAEPAQLPVDPMEEWPTTPCCCGSHSFTPERDVMDTWATSSLTPQLVAPWLAAPGQQGSHLPMSMRPQGHELIRTWAFYTIARSLYHSDALPWQRLLISGWALAGPGEAKISKSRGGGPAEPMDVIECHSADALRYWAASSSPGRDSIINEERIRAGERLARKLWNVARFCEPFLKGYDPPACPPHLSPADQWILARLQRVIREATEAFQQFDYASAMRHAEALFWNDLADNYLEMAKLRLYQPESGSRPGARFALYRTLLGALKLLAPFLPHVTEEIYQILYREGEGARSIHLSPWPVEDERLAGEGEEATGSLLLEIATAARRYKSERNLSPAAGLAAIEIVIRDSEQAGRLRAAREDLCSVTRADQILIIEGEELRVTIRQ